MAALKRSGAYYKRLRREREAALSNGAPGAAPVVVPRPHPIPSHRDLASLTGISRESASRYIDMRRGAITHEEYLISIRGLSEHRSHLADETLERIDGRLRALEQERLGTQPDEPTQLTADNLPTTEGQS